MSTHLPAPCSVKDCSNEAEAWIANIGGRDTFYLCDEHLPECEIHLVINDDGTITNHEVAIYSCAEDCAVCNAWSMTTSSSEPVTDTHISACRFCGSTNFFVHETSTRFGELDEFGLSCTDADTEIEDITCTRCGDENAASDFARIDFN